MKNLKNKIKKDNSIKKLLYNNIPVEIVDVPKKTVDLNKVMQKIENVIPYDLFSGYIEKVIFGNFSFFEERDYNAYYDSKNNFIYIRSEAQDSNIDLFDDLLHEISHAVQRKHHDFIFSDGKIKAEFTKKRLKLFYSLMIDYGDVLSSEKFLVTSYDQELDKLFYKTIGYEKMKKYINGIFPSAYSPTSVDEYWAEGFEKYFLGQKEAISNTCPTLFNKIDTLYKGK
jgi:hypothetical protein